MSVHFPPCGNLQIGVPSLGANRLAETSSIFRSEEIRPDDGRALEAGYVWDLRVDFDFAKVLSELELLLWAEVLVAEEDHAAFGDEKRKLISLLICEIFELEADNFGADVSGKVLDFLRRGE